MSKLFLGILPSFSRQAKVSKLSLAYWRNENVDIVNVGTHPSSYHAKANKHSLPLWLWNFMVLFATSLSLSAQTIRKNLNADWQFMRLDDVPAHTFEAGQQGSSWESQFNVQHVRTSDGNFRLALSDSTLTAERQQLAAANAPWENVCLPHTAKIEDFVIRQPWQGICYYRRNLQVSAEEAAHPLWLEFEAAMQLCDIWLNGKHVMQHAGGFTTFVANLTGLAHEGENELLVRLDNRNNPLIPPGKPLESLDFCYHSGLYRDVWLISKPDIFITHPLLADKPAGGGVFVSYPKVGIKEAVVKVRTEVHNSSKTTVAVSIRHTLYEIKDGKDGSKAQVSAENSLRVEAGNDATAETLLHVPLPRLWSPTHPNLYLLRTEIVSTDARIIDSQETRIGIRRFDLRTDGCYINGQRHELDGANRHQEYPYVGNAVPDRAQYRDMWQMRENGFNTVRLGHYPQDPSVLDACDELGLLVIEPIPGWQFYNADTTFNRLTDLSIRELIRRDRNHPSILLWETTLNESWPPKEWKDHAVETAHAEMPDGQCFTAGDTYGYTGFDVCYNDWDEASFSRPNRSGKPGFIREYYDYEFGGHYSTTRIGRADGERALRQNLWNAQWSLNSNRLHSEKTMGGAVWSMYDYNRGCCDNICESGLADLFRLPKYSLWLFRSQVPAGAFTPSGPKRHEVFIASRCDSLSSDTLVVLGNVHEVELRYNGRTLARQRADHGESTPYTQTTNAGNCEKLNFPPFTFKGIQPGSDSIEAIGYDEAGRKVAKTTVKVPKQPKRLRISCFEGGKEPAADDLIIVYVTLCDAAGNATHLNGTAVSLEVEGGSVQGPATGKAADGTAAFIVRTDRDARKLRVKASAGTMKQHKTWNL